MADRRAGVTSSRPKTPAEDRTSPAPGEVTAEQDSAEKVARLRDRVSKLRIRGWSLDMPRILMITGGVLLILGLVLIGAAWYGAAHTPYLFEQVPYLISGGLLGLGLTVAGAAFYFAYWLTRQVEETKRQSSRTEEALTRLERALVEAVSNGQGAKPAGSSTRGAANGTFVATAGGSMFHRPDCAVVAGRKDLKKVGADAKGLEPCKMCDPLGAEPVRT
jgi:hypothetical protein